MKFVKVLVMFSCSLFWLTACQPAEQNQSVETQPAAYAVSPPECSLTLGFDAWEPYQYMTVGNVVTGLDIELARTIVAGMNCDLQIMQASWVELLGMLREGQIDFVLGASLTPERQSFAHFSEPYRQERFALYVRTEQATLPYQDMRQFLAAGHKLGIVNDYYYGDEVAELYADDKFNAQFVGAIISEMNMARLLDEEIDGFLEDSFVATSILRRKGLDRFIEPHQISLGNSDVFVMFSKQSVEEQQVVQFNDILRQLQNNGEYQRLMDKYQQ